MLKTATLSQIKKELNLLTKAELVEKCTRIAKYKKENKELLNYLLFEQENEQAFIDSVKEEVNVMFSELPISNIYRVKKSLRKIIRFITKYIKYSSIKSTEVELRICFCQNMKKYNLPISRSKVLENMFDSQLIRIEKVVTMLHEDVQFDYSSDIEALKHDFNSY